MNNREIRFRGRRIDNGEWAYGFLFWSRFDNVRQYGLTAMIQVLNLDESTYNCYEVEYSTVGQFTGQKDKNKVEIYEHDVCRFNWNPLLNEPSGIFEFEVPVSYYLEWGCFVFLLQNKRATEVQRELFHDYGGDEIPVAIGSPITHGSGVEVIGNRFSSPELVE